MAENANNSGGKLALLTTLAQSGDTWVKLGIMLMVAISGITNFVNTQRTGEQASRLTKAEAERISKEIHTIYENQQIYIRADQDTHQLLYEIKARLTQQQSHP